MIGTGMTGNMSGTAGMSGMSSLSGMQGRTSMDMGSSMFGMGMAGMSDTMPYYATP